MTSEIKMATIAYLIIFLQLILDQAYHSRYLLQQRYVLVTGNCGILGSRRSYTCLSRRWIPSTQVAHSTHFMRMRCCMPGCSALDHAKSVSIHTTSYSSTSAAIRPVILLRV